jgi:hypothetical protein
VYIYIGIYAPTLSWGISVTILSFGGGKYEKKEEKRGKCERKRGKGKDKGKMAKKRICRGNKNKGEKGA